MSAARSETLKHMALTIVAFVVAPVLPLLMLFSGIEYLSSPRSWNPLRQIPYIVANGSFSFGMRFMNLAELFLALPLHLVLRRLQVTSPRSYAVAGALTGTIACLISWLLATVNDLLRFLVLCMAAWGVASFGVSRCVRIVSRQHRTRESKTMHCAIYARVSTFDQEPEPTR